MKTAATQKARRRTIALLVDSLIEDYEVRIWSSVGEVAKKHDVNLLCFACGTLDSPYLFSSQRGVLFDLIEAAVDAGHIDGILALSGSLANFSTPEKLLKTYARFSKVPLVSLSAEFKGIPSITVDNAGGMHDMVLHMIKKHGRRRIAFVSGPPHSYDAGERLEAYKRALRDCSLPFDPNLVAPGDFMPPSGEQAVALFMDERKVKFDGLVGANDYTALDAMKALLARGVSIPEDVAVVGFDDVKEARSIIPTLSSVRQPKEFGSRAAGLLLEMLQGKKAPQHILLPSLPVYRESCGCIVFKTRETQAPSKRGKTSGLKEALARAAEECRENFPVISETLESENWIEQLAAVLHADLDSNISAFTFLPRLRELVTQGTERGLDILVWTEFLYLLFNRLAPVINPENPLPRLAFLVMNQLTEASEVLQRRQYEEHTLHLYRVYQQMITSLNLETLREITSYALPRLQINNCYISTYVDPKAGLRGGMHPVVAFEDGKNAIAGNQAVFSAAQILPGAGLEGQDRRFSFAVHALFFEHDQIGYAVYDTSKNVNSTIYEVLTGQISSLLKGSSLLDAAKNYAKNLEAEVQQRTADLQKKTEEVERLNRELILKNKIDSLTALYNRGAFFEVLKGEFNRMRRLYQKIRRKHPIDASFCIMMIDIDHFKHINDTYGHISGDHVLKQLGELLNSKSIFRREDLAGRFGGEEFIVVLINATTEKALLPAMRLTEKLTKTVFKADDGREFKVTVSIGISQYYPEDPNEETVIGRADKALYHAKETGRNKIVLYEEEFPLKAE
ncbi:MAG TPA: GGDEF domain-containing protein [Gammaproteobacteria bacterium]|nr:GGDEF domain-containing protein [Gammaproteobacteria bacterium]